MTKTETPAEALARIESGFSQNDIGSLINVPTDQPEYIDDYDSDSVVLDNGDITVAKAAPLCHGDATGEAIDKTARIAKKLRNQIDATRLWNAIDSMLNPEPLWRTMAQIAPWAFRDVADLNSLNFAYYESSKSQAMLFSDATEEVND